MRARGLSSACGKGARFAVLCWGVLLPFHRSAALIARSMPAERSDRMSVQTALRLATVHRCPYPQPGAPARSAPTV
jgi:hypothetical protein